MATEKSLTIFALAIIAFSLTGCNGPPRVEDDHHGSTTSCTTTGTGTGTSTGTTTGTSTSDDPDRDGDGVLVPADCDDDDPSVYPGAGDECGNGLSDDCDEEIDEGCECTPGDVDACYTGTDMTRDVGECHDGDMTCGSHGEWGSCVNDITPVSETCNGLDDDCDGHVDEGNVCGGGEGGSGGTTTTTLTTTPTTSTSTGTGTGTSTGTTTTTSTSTSTTTTTSTSTSTTTTSTTSTSTTSTTTTSTTTTSAPVLGTLSITVLAQDQGVSHAYAIYGYEEGASRPGAWAWGTSPNATVTAKSVQFDIQVEQGKGFVFNGQVDGGDWWIDDAADETVLISAKWEGEPINLPAASANGQDGFNFRVVASDVSCPSNDQDCDGYTANDADQSYRDCSDTDALRRPFQFETWGDSIDYDCDGQVDPESWKYAFTGLAAGWLVELVDGDSWSNTQNGFTTTYAMTYSASISGYAVTIGSWEAPTNYIVRYRQSASNTWSWDPADLGTCVRYYTHQVTTVPGNTIVPFTMEGTYCHFVKQ